MKYIVLSTVIIILTSSADINAQIKRIVLENAERVDTINNKKLIGEIEKKDFIIGTNLFFTDKYVGGSGIFLFEKKRNFWVVYSFDSNLSNAGISKNYYINNSYVKIYSYRHKEFYEGDELNFTNEHYNYSFYYLIDYRNKKYTSIMSRETIERYRKKSDKRKSWKEKTTNKSTIWFKNNSLTIRTIGKSESLMVNGVYKITN